MENSNIALLFYSRYGSHVGVSLLLSGRLVLCPAVDVHFFRGVPDRYEIPRGKPVSTCAVLVTFN